MLDVTQDGARGDKGRVYLLDIDRLDAALTDMLSDAAGRTATAEASVDRAMTDDPLKFRQAFVELLLKRKTVVVDPTTAPQYYGPDLDGNPIAFFVRRYRLLVKAGGYYQADLQRDCPRLFNAVRDALRYKDYRENAQAADDELVRNGLDPFFCGKRVRDITDIGDLLPSRKKIEPRRPEPAEFTRVEPEYIPAK